jgi:hypothetical protein
MWRARCSIAAHRSNASSCSIRSLTSLSLGAGFSGTCRWWMPAWSSPRGVRERCFAICRTRSATRAMASAPRKAGVAWRWNAARRSCRDRSRSGAVAGDADAPGSRVPCGRGAERGFAAGCRPGRGRPAAPGPGRREHAAAGTAAGAPGDASLLWAPLDFSALLQFLTHPLHPIHPMARRRIAERLADAPGIGGKGWQELLDEIAADLGERGARVMADVAFWIEHERFDPAERAPLSVALERAERLATFFSNRLLDEDLARRAAWHAGHAQASALRLALQALMAQGDDRIGPEMLNKLVAQASGRGSGNPLLDAQAGALPSVTDPAAVVEPFDEVTWWQLAARADPGAVRLVQERDRIAACSRGGVARDSVAAGAPGAWCAAATAAGARATHARSAAAGAGGASGLAVGRGAARQERAH